MNFLLLPVALLAAPLVLMCMLRWRWGFLGLLVYLPFAGVVSLSLSGEIPKLFKDLFFAIPCIAMFFLAGRDSLARAPLPSWLTMLLAFYAFVAFAQVGNPQLYDWRVAMIGIKVSLLYLPLVYVAAAFCERGEEVATLMRRLLIVGLVPCGFGIATFMLSLAMGYENTMRAIYGAAAEAVTQDFTRFDFGATLGRFNSTFTFAAQYGQFCLAMIVPAYAVAFADPTARWRLLGKIGLGVVLIAGLLSGSRSLFVFMPLLLLLTLIVDARLTKMFAGLLLGPVFVLTVLEIAGFDVMALFTGVSHLATVYSKNVAVAGLLDTIASTPLGTGTGMATIASRHVLPEDYVFVAVENYYAKVVVELGVMGLLALLAIFAGLVVLGLNARRQTAGTPLQPAASALLGYLVTMMLTSGKGWALDLDPANVYFWVFAGLMIKLPYLTTQVATAAQAPQQHPFLASLKRPPQLLR